MQASESRQIDKPLDALYEMQEQELIDYFEQKQVGKDELLQLLKDLNVKPQGTGRRSLMQCAARELSETGRFLRIASKGR